MEQKVDREQEFSDLISTQAGNEFVLTRNSCKKVDVVVSSGIDYRLDTSDILVTVEDKRQPTPDNSPTGVYHFYQIKNGSLVDEGTGVVVGFIGEGHDLQMIKMSGRPRTNPKLPKWLKVALKHVGILERQVVQSKSVPPNIYQSWIKTTANYPGNINYPILGLSAEVGEVANDLVKIMRDKDKTSIETSDLTIAEGEKMMEEMGDALCYLTMACNELGITLQQLAYKNFEKLNEREMTSSKFKNPDGK